MTKVIVKLPKHIRGSKSLKQILKQKFCHEKKIKHKKNKKQPAIKRIKRNKKLVSPRKARKLRKQKKLKRRRLIRIQKKLIRRLKRKSQRYVQKKCTFSRVCKCNINGKKVAYTKKVNKKKLFKKGCSIRRTCRRCPNYQEIKRLRLLRLRLIKRYRRVTRKTTCNKKN